MGGKTKTRTKTVTVVNPLNTKMRDELAQQKQKYNQLQSTFDSEMLKLRGQYETSQGKLSNTQQSLTDYMNRLSSTSASLSDYKDRLAGTQGQLSSTQEQLQETASSLNMTQAEFDKWKSAQGTTVIRDGVTAGQTIDTAKDVSTNRQEISKPASSTDLFTRKIKSRGTTENLSNTGLSTSGSSSRVYAGLKI